MSSTEMKFPQEIMDRMELFGGRVDPGTRGDVSPIQVMNVYTNQIDAGARHRPLDPKAVETLLADIKRHGLMQPIGVRQLPSGRYAIVFGLHRLEAFRLGERLAENEFHKGPWRRIPALIYAQETAKFISELKEIAENLIRNPLSQEEQEQHRGRYAMLLKRDLSVQTEPRKTGPKSDRVSGHDDRKLSSEPQKPTVYERIKTDLGVEERTVRRDFANISRRAAAVAKAEGLPMPKPIHPVKSTPDEIEAVVALSQRHTEARKEVERKIEQTGKGDPRKVMPITPQPPTIITVRVDVTDPQPLVDWFKDRLSETNKPVTKDYIRKLATGLLALIEE